MSHNDKPIDKLDTDMKLQEIDEENDAFDIKEGLGIAKDFVSVARPGVDAGFNIAKGVVDVGFGKTTAVLDSISGYGKALTGKYNPVSLGLDVASSVVQMTEDVSDVILERSKLMTDKVLDASANVLTAYGARDGALLRALGCSKEVVYAMKNVRAILINLGQGLDLSPLALYEALTLIEKIQQVCGLAVIKPIADEKKVDEDLLSYLPQAMGCYGALLMKVMLRVDDQRFDAAYEKLTGARIIAKKLESSIFDPAYVFGFDVQRKAVVVSFRGTLSVADALTDLLQKVLPFTLLNDMTDVYVHEGFYTSAKKICKRLRVPILQALDVSVLTGQWILNRESDVLGKVFIITYEGNSGPPKLNIIALDSCQLRCIIEPVSEAVPNPLPSYTFAVGTSKVTIELRRDCFRFPTVDISIVEKDSSAIKRYTASRQSSVFAAPFRLVLCGHSLGASIAQVTASIWLATKCFEPYNLVCFGYNPPCSFTMPLARHPIFLKSIYSIIIGFDLVSRVCRGSVWELHDFIMYLEKMKRKEPESYKLVRNTAYRLASKKSPGRAGSLFQMGTLMALMKNMKARGLHLPYPKLFPVGRTFHIASGEALKYVWEKDRSSLTEFHNECLSNIIVKTPMMILDHARAWKLDFANQLGIKDQDGLSIDQFPSVSSVINQVL